MTETTLVALLFAGGLLAPAPAHADVNIGINVAPPPAIVVASPPRLVAVPGSPVFYGPGANHNLFVYAGHYYSFHGGAWFVAASPGSSWSIIATNRVPQPVLAVPPTYYKIPPGQAKKMGAQPFVPPGQAKGPKGKKSWKD
jgi:hypothetical protein